MCLHNVTLIVPGSSLVSVWEFATTTTEYVSPPVSPVTVALVTSESTSSCTVVLSCIEVSVMI